MRWFKQLLPRRRRYDELHESIQEHLEEKIEDLMEDGISLEIAEQTARRQFGNVALMEERSREVWQWPRWESFLADLKFAVRHLVRNPGFTVTVIFTLASQSRRQHRDFLDRERSHAEEPALSASGANGHHLHPGDRSERLG